MRGNRPNQSLHCQQTALQKGYHLPEYEFIPDIKTEGCCKPTADEYLKTLVKKGYAFTYKNKWTKRSKEHIDRLNKELTDIEDANLADYFLIVWDVVNWARSNDIPIGPGRGCLTDNSYVLTLDGYKSIK